MKCTQFNIGKYLFRRLEQLGLRHIFGVPGDFIFDLLHLVPESNIQYIGTCNELNAGYAADAYARFNGIGGILVTYAVGSLSTVNAIAGAFAEKVPMIVISGGPELSSYSKQPQKHHVIGDYAIPLEIFKNITAASDCILDPESATTIIDKLLKTCIQQKQPVYLEIPCDIVNHPCQAPGDFDFTDSPPINTKDLSTAVAVTVELLSKAQNPIIIVGSEVQRYALQDLLEELIKTSNIPFSTFITDKATLPEDHPQFIGSCGPGIRMKDSVKEYIENSDCILSLGSVMANHLKDYMTYLKPEILVSAFNREVSINGNIYDVTLSDFVETLNKTMIDNHPKRSRSQFKDSRGENNSIEIPKPHKNLLTFKASTKITNNKLFEGIASLLEGDEIFIVDTGSSIIPARELFMPKKNMFLAQSYYASIGYSLAATLGVALANPRRKIITVIGDGAFQFTCQELSTLIKQRLDLTIFLINNNGYTIERALFRDSSYNDIQAWKYHKLPLIFGGVEGYEVKTEEQLQQALEWTKSNTGVSLIEVHLDKLDYSKDLVDMLEP